MPTGQNPQLEEEITSRFPKAFPEIPHPLTHKPSIIVDRHGVILAWYLPEVLTQTRQVGLHFIRRSEHQGIGFI